MGGEDFSISKVLDFNIEHLLFCGVFSLTGSCFIASSISSIVPILILPSFEELESEFESEDDSTCFL